MINSENKRRTKNTQNHNNSSPSSYDPRLLALEVLDYISISGVTIDIALEKKMTGKNLSRPDQGLANAIIYGVLRHRGMLDWIVSCASTTEIVKIEPSVLNILRIGIFQIKYLDRIPVSASVNTSVELAKKIRKKPFISKFINAVLRKSVSIHEGMPFPDPALDETDYFYARHSIPGWLSSRWIARFGIEQAEALAEHVNSIPPLSLRVNTLKGDRDSLAEKLKVDSDTVELHNYSENGLNITGLKQNIQNLLDLNEGVFQVQDEAAQMIAILLDPKPGERVLDACCGLGGKTGHIGQIMKNDGIIIASDNDPRKLIELNQEMKRLGITNVSTIVQDFENPLENSNSELFDRILVDAPCSGLGVLRRNPDAKWTESKKDLSRYSKRQSLILINAADAVKPGGRLVYAVCSFEPEENQDVVSTFLQKRPDYILDENIPEILKKHPFNLKDTEYGDKSGMIRILPHIAGMDGFFAACFKKIDIKRS
ncbi:16S rRNA (cytosine(967)-C(5))-methyltransferase RsmB [Desulforegula conservatrix]|uniref:16S rRNA (cytosine(967)-C(5))-methyltransferase RsmB n=1 Tax=Desulforegula conservatrix TaxID=153026 RepID=UPI0004000B0D|nr:16S rRNA (cytosine(967)-C(5))-methyltransferase RsmB [Desulforegula conservatrix]